MTLAELLAEIQRMDFPQALDPDYIGSCPCWDVERLIDGQWVRLQGRCWRVSDGRETQDLFISGGLPDAALKQIGQALKAQLDQQEWYRPYAVTVGVAGPEARR